MSNSSLVNYTKISPNKTAPRKDKIKKITIHHMAGNLSVETCGNVFASSARQASSNYGIDSNGRVGMYVEEKDRAWTSSSPSNDNQAITIEVANDEIGGNWHVSDKALAKLIDLCADICKRNGIEKLNYTEDATGNLTRHNMFVATSCPGAYLQGKFPYIAEQVNARLGKVDSTPESKPTLNEDSYLVKVTTDALNIRAGAGTNHAITGCIRDKGTYSIVETAGNWGKLKSGAGWICLDYTQKAENASSNTSSSAPSTSIKVGDKVKVKDGAKSYTSGGLASFVYKTTYDVIELKGDRAVIGLGKSVTTAINISNIYKV